MKKLVILSLLVCMSILSMVAEVSNNVKFMGISMDAPFSEFVSSLAKKCELVEASSSYAVFKGNFAGLTDCSIMVASTDGVLLTMVLSPEYNKWQQLKSDFIAIADAYEKKYGTPTRKTLDFDAGYYDGCGEEMKAVKNDSCNYGVAYLIDQRLLVTILISDECKIVFAYAIVEEEKAPTQINVNTDDI